MNVSGLTRPPLQGLILVLKLAKRRALQLKCPRLLPWLDIAEAEVVADTKQRVEALKALDELQVNYNPTERSDALYGKIRAVLRVDVALIALFVGLTCASLIPEYEDDYAKRGAKVVRICRGREWLV